MKDANELLVAQGPEGFARTWARLRAEASASAAALVPHEASAPAPAPERPTAKEEKPIEPLPPPSSPSPPPLPPLVLDDQGTYVFDLSPRVFRVRGLASFGVDRLRVNLRIDQGARFHVDTFDLYSARSRNSFIEACARALRLDESDETQIAEEISLLIQALEKERLSLRKEGTPGTAAAPVMTDSDRKEAMAWLLSDIVGSLPRDFEAVGCVGERTALLIGFFALISRKLPKPLSILFCARSGAGKSALQDALCELVPPEDLVRYTRISGQVLFYKDENALVRKVLAVDEEDGASTAAYALRSLVSTGELRSSITRTDPKTGRQVSEDYLVRGPTCTLLTSAHPEVLDYESRNRFVLVTVDESREQTKRILERQLFDESVEGLIASESKKAVLRRHHNAQRLLEPLRVVIPFKVRFPTGWLILRREQKKYLTLLKAIALLYQHQRPRKTLRGEGGEVIEYIEVTKEDVEIARPLAAVILKRNLDELAPPSRSLVVDLARIVALKRKALGEAQAPAEGAAERNGARTRRYVLRPASGAPDERLCPDRHEIQKATELSYWHVRTYMAQLIEYGYVREIKGCQGKKILYELLWDGEDEDPWADVSEAPKAE